MTTPQVRVTDLQFVGSDDTNSKLRRFVKDVQDAEKAINALLAAVAALQTSSVNPTGAQLLADPTLVAENFTVENLAPGQVLTALTATAAAFRKLSLSDLADVLEAGPVNGQVLTFIDGQWLNANPPGSSGTSGTNIGLGEDVYAGLLIGKLAFKTIASDGATIGVSASGDTITLSYIGPTIAGPIGPVGPAGFDGEQGEEGQPGLQGLRGPAGAAGTPGTPGLDGDAGEDGFPGAPGLAGPRGLQGPPGMDGDPGEDGLPGAAGAAGATGATGPAGPAGGGSSNTLYAPLMDEWTGEDIIPTASSTWPSGQLILLGTASFYAPTGASALNLKGATGTQALNVNAGSGGASAAFFSPNVAGQSFGVTIAAGTNTTDSALTVANAAQSITFLNIRGDGLLTTVANVVVAAPASGIPLTVNAVAGQDTIRMAGDLAIFDVRNTALTSVLQIATVKGWVGSGSVTDAAIGAIGALNLYSNGSGAAAFSIATTGAMVMAAPTAGTTLAISGLTNANIFTLTDGTVTSGYQTGTGLCFLGTLSNHPLHWMTNNADRVVLSAAGGLFMAPAAGGDKGGGTFNANALFIQGVAVVPQLSAVKAALTARATTTVLANDPDLVIAIPSAGTWEIVVTIGVYNTAGATVGISYNLNYSGTFTALPSIMGSYSGAGLSITQTAASIVAAATTSMASVNVGVSIAVQEPLTLRGVLVATGAGNLGFAWAQLVSNATGTTVAGGSRMTARKIV